MTSGAATWPIAETVAGPAWAGLILLLPLVSTALCGLCAALRVRSKLPAWITVALLAGSFATTLALYAGLTEPISFKLFGSPGDPNWLGIDVGAARPFVANFAFYVDRLTLLWMLFVTGLGTLIALYASEYMEPDVGGGYARFFAGISVFLFAMSALVTADNLVMLYLGWEGVGFASYWLIGYYYKKPSAVAAAKKAFIVNRIGDLGLALGIWLVWHNFHTVEYGPLFEMLRSGHARGAGGWSVEVLPFLFMLAAFGKSAQIPLYVWLPDAMEGPTPVSALIHAATMVTAGVYLLCRLFPVMELHPLALPTVAWVGGLTALLAATIGMAQHDVKRIFAYSTVSQLGYMFLGVGLLTTVGAAYHTFTHAFFKAVLFLSAGAVMHGFAGQIDLRKISGLARLPGWKVTSFTMLYACLCLAGFPVITNGFWSKDAIMAEAFVRQGPGYGALGIIALVTAGLTAYYTFRVWFRLCAGPVHFEPGDEHHGHEHAGGQHAAAFEPHAPGWAINAVLLVISAGAVGSIFLSGWAERMVARSSAAAGIPEAAVHPDPHAWMPWVASATGLLGILIAWYFHLANRRAADAMREALLSNPLTRWLPVSMENKWFVDEIYDVLICRPLWWLGKGLAGFDRYVVDWGLVDGVARLPRALGRGLQPLQNGLLQSYALSMMGGSVLVALLVFYLPEVMPQIVAWLEGLWAFADGALPAAVAGSGA